MTKETGASRSSQHRVSPASQQTDAEETSAATGSRRARPPAGDDASSTTTQRETTRTRSGGSGASGGGAGAAAGAAGTSSASGSLPRTHDRAGASGASGISRAGEGEARRADRGRKQLGGDQESRDGSQRRRDEGSSQEGRESSTKDADQQEASTARDRDSDDRTRGAEDAKDRPGDAKKGSAGRDASGAEGSSAKGAAAAEDVADSRAAAGAGAAGAAAASEGGQKVAEGAQAAEQAQKAAQNAETAQKAVQAAENAGKAAEVVEKGDKVVKGMDGAKAQAAGKVAQKAVEGDGSNAKRNTAGRYVGGAVSGAIIGAEAGAAAGGVGAAPGAAIGAAKNVAWELGKDTVGKKLGVGGTSYDRARAEQAGGGSSGGSSDESSGLGTTAAGLGTAAVTPAAGSMFSFMVLLQWLKYLLMQIMAKALSWWQTALYWAAVALNYAKSIFFMTPTGAAMKGAMVLGNGVLKGVKAVSGALGMGVSLVLTPLATAVTGAFAGVGILAMIGSLLLGMLTNPMNMAASLVESSRVCTSSGLGAVGADLEVSASTEANAQAVYSVFKSWDMPDENIAGILGNWSEESGIDPTSVEGIFDEPYAIGPRKQAAWDGNFTHIPGQSHGGIGLGQWSNSRTTMLLDYASSKGKNWYELETQLAFMVDGDSEYDRNNFKSMISESKGTPGEAAMYFHENWERSADDADGLAERREAAEMWFGKMSGWSVDDSIAGGIEDVVGAAVGGTVTAINSLGRSCETASSGIGLSEGGMTMTEAQALVDLFNKEGDKFLDDRYGTKGPAICDSDPGNGGLPGNHAMNCVSFSTYFLNKYTSFQDAPAGNGVDIAGSVASMTGKSLSSTPTPYSVGSAPVYSSAGHTLIVLGVEGEKVIVGEAGYCSYMGRVRETTVSELQAQGWKFVDMSDSLTGIGVGDQGSDPGDIEITNGFTPTGNAIVDAAGSQIGHPYVWAGGGKDGPGTGNRSEDAGEVGYDCSGLVQYAYYTATGKVLPRVSGQQKAAGTVISASQAQPGDIVWWPGHVGIYAGNGQVIHASGSQNQVVQSSIWGSPTYVRI